MELTEANEELVTLYHNFYKKSINDIKAGSHAIDLYLDRPDDNRRGLSLIIRPDDAVKRNIAHFMNELGDIDDTQYYQPSSDLHITALSLISCHDNFGLDQIDPAHYIDIISKSLQSIDNLAVRCKGVTFSKEAGMIQGFMLNDNLTLLRHQLRANFANSSLMQDIDKRYPTKAAHITCVRFRNKCTDPDRYTKVIEKYRNFDFGETRNLNIDLIYTDWYCRQSKIKLLKQFALCE